MGGKGRRRREKNYQAAHGGNRRLPPPPDPSSIDAIPSKLRKLMSLTGEKASSGSEKKKNGNGGRNTEKKLHLGDKLKTKVTGTRRDGEDGKSVAQDPYSSDEVVQNNTLEKNKKKRKRKQVNDLRFDTPDAVTSSKRKERKKQRSEERKKKRKMSKDEHADFPACDQVKFGDVVQAPPKLVAVPKAFKSVQDASQERLRIRAVEAYRERKAWASRPGFQLQPAVAMSPSL